MSSTARTDHLWDHDVFVSFRGEEVRENFLSHLFAEFDRRGIEYYRDNDKRETGLVISDKLIHAIHHSRVFVLLFSSRYADSSWCLNELVLMLEQHKKNKDHVLVPIFFRVGAGEVRKQTGTFGENFQQAIGMYVAGRLEGIKTDDLKLITSWKTALEEAGKRSGLRFQLDKGSEAKFLEEIVDHLSNNVFSKSLPYLPEITVPIESRVKQVLLLLDMDAKDGQGPHVVGLHGDPDMGKTVLAGIVFMRICHKFEGSSFIQLEDAADPGYLANLQRKLLSDIFKVEPPRNHDLRSNAEEIKKKVRGRTLFIVLDNLTTKRQASAFALGDPEQSYSMGTRIIITTRNDKLLEDLDVVAQRKVEKLGPRDALLLFSRVAFGSDCPKKGTEKLCDLVLQLSEGCSSHLAHLGHIVRWTKEGEWYQAIEKWQSRRFPDRSSNGAFPPEEVGGGFIFDSSLAAENPSKEEEVPVDPLPVSVIVPEEDSSVKAPTETGTALSSEEIEDEDEVIDPLPSPIGLMDAPEADEELSDPLPQAKSEEGETVINPPPQSVESEEHVARFESQDKASDEFPWSDRNGKPELVADSPMSPVIGHGGIPKANGSNGHPPEIFQSDNAEEFGGVMNDNTEASTNDPRHLFQIAVRVEEKIREAPENLVEFQDFLALSKLLGSLHASHVLPPPISLACHRISSRLLRFDEVFPEARTKTEHLEKRLYKGMERISRIASFVLSRREHVQKMKDELSCLIIQDQEAERKISQLQRERCEIKQRMECASQEIGSAIRNIEESAIERTNLEKENKDDSRELYEFQNLLTESRGSLAELRMMVQAAKSFLKAQF